MKQIFTIVIVLLSGLIGCSDSDDQPPIENPKVVSFSFADATTNWDVGFADYPVENNDFYELLYEYRQLPEPLQQESGLLVSGNNYSDDLFMYATKRFSGFQPNSRYSVEFELLIASAEPSGCFGIGGTPGENVYVKAGATVNMPHAVDLGTGSFLMNIDKGNQSSAGSDAIVIGDMANGLPCIPERQYMLKELNSEGQTFELLTGADGSLWLIFGTDSGFEGTTAVYYLSGKITATLID